MAQSATVERPRRAEEEDWWRGAIIYQIYPRSFQDSNGDGVGDLRGITQRLDHVAELGADAIWISPFFASPMFDFGYDVSDYKSVDPMFGTIGDFGALVEKAHGLGIKVLIDLVLSHTSDRHVWFEESRASRSNAKADWYVWADAKSDGTPPNNWLSLFGGSAWEWDARRQQYYLHNFLKQQPDLNFHNADVQDALLDVARFWLELGVDGFRLDTVNFYFHDRQLRDNPPNNNRDSFEIPLSNPYAWQNHLHDKSQPENLDFLRRLRSLLDGFGKITTVGEVGDGDRAMQTIAAYTSGGDKLHMCYAFDYLSRSFGKKHFADTIRSFEKTIGNGWGCWAFSNHDVERHVSRWSGFIADRQALARLCAAILAGLRGAICVYQGEELGLEESDVPYELIQDPYGRTFWPEFKGRDGCRTPIPWPADGSAPGFSTSLTTWLPIDANQADRVRRVLGGESPGVLDDYKRLFTLRHTYRALRDGSIRIVPAPDDILAFEREATEERILCAFNMSDSAASWRTSSASGGKVLHAVEAEAGADRLKFGPAGAIYLKFDVNERTTHG